MLEAKFKSGETMFFANGGIIESHTCMGSFELEGEMKYVITPYGKLNTIPEGKTFKTFEEAKQSIVDEADQIVVNAQAQADRVRTIEEKDVAILPSTPPTAEELKEDDAKHGQK